MFAGLGWPSSSWAQQEVEVTGPPSEIIGNVYTSAILGTLGSIQLFLPSINQALVAEGFPPVTLNPDRLALDLAQDVATAFVLTSSIGNELSTFPLGSSAGGFSWTFDPSLGVFNRASDSFGPLFADRALTLGEGRFSAGVNFQRATFDTFQGKGLDDGEIQFYSEVVPDIVGLGTSFVRTENTLNLKLSTTTVGLFANYGATDRLDVGVAVPIVSVKLDAGLHQRLALFDGTPLYDTVFRGRAGATGLGDLTLRGKYRFFDVPGGGLAAAVDLRLPTGNEHDFLGIPATQTEVFLIGSAAYGRVAPHVNVGYTFSSANDLVDPDGFGETAFLLEPPAEFNLAGGVDVSVVPKVTVAGDVLIRTLRNTARLVESTSEVGPGFQEFRTAFPTNVTVSYGSLGVKLNTWGDTLLTGNVLFPLNRNGLQDSLMLTVGIDVSF
ncbi:MAG: hypothetical protein ABS36_13555 [Acidobacteria bacterium SCN 69-37]|nr:MAG: hypothetical protein ABS36_13555 [Acidobacteria bacterium SCN 69-37]